MIDESTDIQSIFPSAQFNIVSRQSEHTIQALPFLCRKVFSCKQRWIGRSLSQVFRDEFAWNLIPEIHVVNLRLKDVHEDIDYGLNCEDEMILLLRNQKESCSVSEILENGDKIFFNRFIVEPEINLTDLPYVIYEDDSLIAAYKPHALPTLQQGTFLRTNLYSILQGVLSKRTNGSTHYLQPLNRLDRCTAGIVVFARSAEVYEEAEVSGKVYIAMVSDSEGNIPNRPFQVTKRLHVEKHVSDQVLRTVVDETFGVEAHTKFSRRLLIGDKRALVLCRPVTGRTHQIRAHLASVGLAIVDDNLYDNSESFGSLKSQPERIKLAALRYIIKLKGSEYEFKLSRFPNWASSINFADVSDLINDLDIC